MTSAKKGRGRKPVHKDGLFDDLQDFTKGEISEKISSIKAAIEAGEKDIQRMQQERESEIALVQSLRAIQETTRGNSKERNELLNEFRKIRDKAQKTKAQRDQINQINSSFQTGKTAGKIIPKIIERYDTPGPGT